MIKYFQFFSISDYFIESFNFIDKLLNKILFQSEKLHRYGVFISIGMGKLKFFSFNHWNQDKYVSTKNTTTRSLVLVDFVKVAKVMMVESDTENFRFIPYSN